MASSYKVKDVNYHPRLVTADEVDEKVMSLFRVQVSYPGKKMVEVYVLSYSDEEAASMARCFVGCATYEVTKEIDKLVHTDVTRLDFCIQGWGASKF